MSIPATLLSLSGVVSASREEQNGLSEWLTRRFWVVLGCEYDLIFRSVQQ
jgi:hypothetical protein